MLVLRTTCCVGVAVGFYCHHFVGVPHVLDQYKQKHAQPEQRPQVTHLLPALTSWISNPFRKHVRKLSIQQTRMNAWHRLSRRELQLEADKSSSFGGPRPKPKTLPSVRFSGTHHSHLRTKVTSSVEENRGSAACCSTFFRRIAFQHESQCFRPWVGRNTGFSKTRPRMAYASNAYTWWASG